MTEIVNLRRARKRKARAAENRAAFGRPKAERRLEAARETLTERRLDAHRIRGDGDE